MGVDYDFRTALNELFGKNTGIKFVTEETKEDYERALNNKYRDTIFDPRKMGDYKKSLDELKNQGCKIYRNSIGVHKIVITEHIYGTID